jgi:hypothetical protein
MLCCVQYLKRLYKACIDNRVKESDENLKRLGYLLYFLLRPVYAMVFTIVTVFAMLAGIIVVSMVDFVVNYRFMYLCVVVSSVIGFSIGRVLDTFEVIGKSKISTYARNNEECKDE